MTLGPLEYIVIGFTENNFDGSIAEEIGKVVANKTIRIVDAVFITKDAGGDAIIVELDNKDDPRFAAFAPILEDRMGLLTPEDLLTVAASIPPDTSALALMFEHHWAVDIKEAMAAKGGFLIGRTVIQPEILEELADELAAHEAALAAGAA